MADFRNQHALATAVNQLQPQKLSNNVWLGPLNSVAQNDFLSQNNIKFIVGILPSQKCCYYLRDLSSDLFCCVSIDPNFNVQKLTEDEGACLMKFNTKFTPNISTLTENRLSNAVVTNINFQKILNDFLDIMHSAQKMDPQAGILLFSLNGNDNMLSTFALSYIMDQHNCDLTQAFSYLRSIRPSVKDFDELGFYANELVKFSITLKSVKAYGALPSLKTKRSAADVVDHDDAELESPRLKRTFV
ncbi:CYFA0S09e03334g1_1 [Cyberlindnera fabianii]|uniref:CYFA0S09e03334g1_1 n=1 Tax=Cyberlindnera fabianii TaxID=36022 RepID=A0A061AXY8_CYBFA|nr:Dual specificity protein phosphatase 14 [Cyberlindnera fabianii]CDR42426.1 CYFA0S09e03334g1_1 [Cyberlindnera fabianii]